MNRNQLNLTYKHRDRVIETINLLELYRLRGLLNMTIAELQADLRQELKEIDGELEREG